METAGVLPQEEPQQLPEEEHWDAEEGRSLSGWCLRRARWYARRRADEDGGGDGGAGMESKV